MTTTIITADDDRGFRGIVQSLLSHDTAITVIGEAENGAEAVRATRELHPDIVLLDITMPGANGFEATRLIKAYRPQTKVIILTVHADFSYAQAATESGADAFIAKKRLSSELLRTIHGLIDSSAAAAVIRNDNGTAVPESVNGEAFGARPRSDGVAPQVAEKFAVHPSRSSELVLRTTHGRTERKLK